MIKSTSTLRGEKLKDKEVRATKRVGKWSLGGPRNNTLGGLGASR